MAEPFDAADLPHAEEADPFSGRTFHFTTGVSSGELAAIRSESGAVLLSYRGFANVVGIVAALVAAIVGVAGLAGTALLLAEGAPVRAAVALLLTATFVYLITLLVPKVHVTLFDNGTPVLAIAQKSAFPIARIAVLAPDGSPIAGLRRGFASRLGRTRWVIDNESFAIGEAYEPSLSAALIRKVAGKFDRRFETDVVIEQGAVKVARIRRRPDAAGRADVLEITSELADRRIAVALATLILGGEP